MKDFRLKKSQALLSACLAFIGGIAIASFLPPSGEIYAFAAALLCLAIAIIFWTSFKIKWAALLGLFLFLGIWRYQFFLPENTPDKIWHYNGQEITIIGNVADEPDSRQSNVKYEIEVRQAKLLGGSPLSVKGKILATANLYPKYNYGDKLEIICRPEAPKKYDDFAYDRYLARYNIYSVCYYPEINLLESGDGNRLYAKILNWKNKLRGAIDNGLTEPTGGLARAIMLGDRKGVEEEWLQKFSRTGTTHIMAISGMNITILSALAINLLIWLGFWRRQAFYAAIIILVLYLFLIGMPPSAARAGVMGLLILLALHLGRLNKLSHSIFFAAALLLFLNPKLLRDDIGFQLSFLAVLGIGWFYPILGKWAERISSRFLKAAADGLNITIAAQIFTLPIIAYNFSSVSLISPIANILIIWTMPVLMACVLAAFIPAIIFPGIAFLFFMPVFFIEKYILFITDFLSRFPYAYFNVRNLWPNWASWMVFYYGAIFLIYYFYGRFSRRQHLL